MQPEQINYIKENYQHRLQKEIAAVLKTSKWAIGKYMRENGLVRPGSKNQNSKGWEVREGYFDCENYAKQNII